MINGTTVSLRYGTDFTVSYKNNIDVGTASITIYGKGNFNGYKGTTFKIVPKVITPTISKISSQYYSGKGKVPESHTMYGNFLETSLSVMFRF